jgi:hypothetical protein
MLLSKLDNSFHTLLLHFMVYSFVPALASRNF